MTPAHIPPQAKLAKLTDIIIIILSLLIINRSVIGIHEVRVEAFDLFDLVLQRRC